MKTGAKGIVGKRISSVSIKISITRGPELPLCLLLIYFNDGTCYEFYAPFSAFTSTSGVNIVGLEGFINNIHCDYTNDFLAIEDPDAGDVSVKMSHFNV